MNYYMLGADFSDVISYVLLSAITTSDVLQWVYTIILICSLLCGLILKIVSAVKDHKITEDELNDIQNQLDDAKGRLKKELDDTKDNANDSNKEEK